MAARLKRFVVEVRRRKVHRTLGVYIVVAIMVLEGADLILPSMAVPTWSYNLLVFLVVSLFPIVLVLSWAFDLTHRGLVRTDALADPHACSTLPTRPYLRTLGGPSLEGPKATLQLFPPRARLWE